VDVLAVEQFCLLRVRLCPQLGESRWQRSISPRQMSIVLWSSWESSLTPQQVDGLELGTAGGAELSQLWEDLVVQNPPLMRHVRERGADEEAEGARGHG
jgi:hypothetical protein